MVSLCAVDISASWGQETTYFGVQFTAILDYYISTEHSISFPLKDTSRFEIGEVYDL